jgi:uncharacterized protein CbrC (UPF0167 family)
MILWEKMKFINCEMEFKCDADWEKMVLTKDPSVRLCQLCQKNVHYCHTQSELDKAINDKKCVFFIAETIEIDGEMKSFIQNIEKAKANSNNEMPKKIITRTVGLPSGSVPKKFLDLDEN